MRSVPGSGDRTPFSGALNPSTADSQFYVSTGLEEIENNDKKICMTKAYHWFGSLLPVKTGSLAHIVETCSGPRALNKFIQARTIFGTSESLSAAPS